MTFKSLHVLSLGQDIGVCMYAIILLERVSVCMLGKEKDDNLYTCMYRLNQEDCDTAYKKIKVRR